LNSARSSAGTLQDVSARIDPVRNRLPHVWLDLDADPAADVLLDYYDTPRDQTPVVVAIRFVNLHLGRQAGLVPPQAAPVS
jgi:hypothetical protein